MSESPFCFLDLEGTGSNGTLESSTMSSMICWKSSAFVAHFSVFLAFLENLATSDGARTRSRREARTL